ncbi:MATE family efflux transporter [Lacrimispora sp. NSJ-141]|uniref:Multidrug export protein MepA n=1 Tax=Lientehia hominis TaxID=2897778 RepID=A0AAP2RHX2_9FIRM|nr:MATE family efflux transporter [Lientehia hominis]MCD2492081.1 MATE family efflux transporter [Lientehia hominis]
MKGAGMEEQLAKGKILPLLLKLAIPSTIAQVVNALYSMVDRIYIGHMEGVGTIALTGLGLTLPIILIITAFSCLVGMGGAPLLSIRLGEKDHKGAAALQGNSFSMLLVLGVLLTIFFYFFCDPILRIFGASEGALPYAASYLRIYVLGTIPVMISMGMNSFLNAQGYTTLGTLTVVIGAVLNLILDPVFIYTFHMGIAGAAIATVIAQLVSAVWVLILLLFSKKIIIRIRLQDMAVKWHNVKKICALGVSNFAFLANDSLVQILMNLLLRKWCVDIATGDMYIGCLTIIYSMYQIFFMPLKGITQGTQPIVGYCFGAGDYGRLKKTVHYARICSMVCATAMWAFFMMFPKPVAGLFTTDAALLDTCTSSIRIAFCFNFVLGMQMVNQHMFVAMGNAKLSLIFALMRKVFVMVPLVLLFPYFMGAYGVFLAEPVSNIITVVVTYICFSRYMKGLLQAQSRRERIE